MVFSVNQPITVRINQLNQAPSRYLGAGIVYGERNRVLIMYCAGQLYDKFLYLTKNVGKLFLLGSIGEMSPNGRQRLYPGDFPETRLQREFTTELWARLKRLRS